MSGLSVGEITTFFVIFVLGFFGLAVLLGILEILILFTRRMLRRQLAASDLDLVGHEALVIKTIRPKKKGQIQCQTPMGERIADAISEEMIKQGNRVLIITTDEDRFRVRPIPQAAQQPQSTTAPDNTLADHSPTLIKSIPLMNQMDGQAMHLEPNLVLPDLLAPKPIAELDLIRFSVAGDILEKNVWQNMETSQDAPMSVTKAQANDEPS